MSINLKPLHDRIIVKRIEAESKTAGGIIIPDSAKEKPIEGKVVAVGEGTLDSNGKRIGLARMLYYGIGNIERQHALYYSIGDARKEIVNNSHFGPWG